MDNKTWFANFTSAVALHVLNKLANLAVETIDFIFSILKKDSK